MQIYQSLNVDILAYLTIKIILFAQKFITLPIEKCITI